MQAGSLRAADSCHATAPRSQIFPPIVCRFPWTSDELSKFTDAISTELAAKRAELKVKDVDVELDLNAITVMNEFLRKRKLEESGTSGVSLWAESHAAIHTWDADNYFAFDAFSCKDFDPRDAIRLLLNSFDIDVLNCVNMLRYQRGAPRVCSFTANSKWDVFVGNEKVGQLDTIDLNSLGQ